LRDSESLRPTLTVKIYGIKNCDTMKKARSWLDGHDVKYEFHDYKVAGLESAVLAQWCAAIGWEKLLNRGGSTFRKLPEPQKIGLNERKAITMMLTQPSLIKRPVLMSGKHYLVGFSPESYEQATRDHS
jgi:arsenate reductase